MGSNIVYSFFFVLLFSAAAQAQQSDHLRYIDKYKKIAIQEMERAGIPASIKLAQAILESNAGKSDLARRANNHFGIKCGSTWNGKTYYKEDDDYDEKGQLIKSCFRSYKNPTSSFIAHSEFLRDPRKEYRYGFLFRLDPQDYKSWAEGLRRAGYATSTTYPTKLISIIERYQLNQYDMLPTSVPGIPSPDEVLVDEGDENVLDTEDDIFLGPGTIYEKNDVRYVFSREGETPNDIALRTKVKLSNILAYNEGLKSRSEKLAGRSIVYIQPKRNSFRGKRKWHDVEEGETMYAISQMYGVRLDKLYDRNRLPSNGQPAVRERVKLRGCKAKSAPKLASNTRPSAPADKKPTVAVPDEDDDGEIDFEGEVDLPDEEPKEVETPRPTPPVRNPPPVKPPTPKDPAPDKEPVKPDTGFGEDKPTPAPTPPATVYHTVAKGDTLYNISRRYNATVEGLKRMNSLSSNTISIGQVLRVQ